MGGLEAPESALSPTKYFFKVCLLIILLPIKSSLVKSPIAELKVVKNI